MNKTVKMLLIALGTFVVLSVLAIIFVIASGLLIVKITQEKESEFVELTTFDNIDESYEYTETLFTNYKDYKSQVGIDKITKKDFEKYNILVFEVKFDKCSESDIEPTGYYLDNVELWIDISYTFKCDFCGINFKYFALKLPKDIKFEIVNQNYEKRNNIPCGYEGLVVDKPMIYIYPEEDMNVEVKLGHEELLTTSYPKYIDSWKVFARKDGILEYDGREYYGLYWEGKNHSTSIQDGFVIKGEDTTKFLEEKLEILGLNEKEINEFIVYWLPKIEHNKYNYIRFETKEEIENYMPLEITPTPDTVIRVYMNFKGLDEKIDVKEQKLTKVNRKGYSVIEWGGSIIYE